MPDKPYPVGSKLYATYKSDSYNRVLVNEPCVIVNVLPTVVKIYYTVVSMNGDERRLGHEVLHLRKKEPLDVYKEREHGSGGEPVRPTRNGDR